MLADVTQHISEERNLQRENDAVSQCYVFAILCHQLPICSFSPNFQPPRLFRLFSLTLRCTWKTRPGRATCTAHAVRPSDVRAMCQARASGILQPQPQQPQPGLVQSVVPKQRPSTSSSEAGIPGCCQRGRGGEYEFVFRSLCTFPL